jgi:hypothetical protein
MRIRTLLLLGAAIALPGCTETVTEYRDRIVTKEVFVPVRAPCPERKDVPVVPGQISDEHPIRPTDPVERERILAGKVAELQGYAASADAIMKVCSDSVEPVPGLEVMTAAPRR